MNEFQTGLPARQAHQNLVSAVQTLEKAQDNALLWFGEIRDRKLFKELGYVDIHQYAHHELGWGRTKTYDFLKITEKLEKLPEVKGKIESGELGYAKARQVVSVANKKTEKEWLDQALKSPKRELEQKVKKAKRRAKEKKTGQAALIPEKPVPVASPSQRVSFEMDPVQLAKFEALWEKLRKLGGLPADRTEALLAVMATAVEMGLGKSNRLDKPPVQIHVHQCPDCEIATVQTNRGERVLSHPQREQLECDAVVSKSGERNKSIIPPRIRREVLTRDRHRCQSPGCQSTHFLEIHHRTPRARGGTNDPDNLITLCSSCHAQAHRGGAMIKEPASGYLGLRSSNPEMSWRLSSKWKESTGANCQNSSRFTVPWARS